MDVLGLVIAVVALATSARDNAAGIALLDEVAENGENADGTVERVLADQGFKSQLVMRGTRLGIDVDIVQRNPQETGFAPQPKRWRVEQT